MAGRVSAGATIPCNNTVPDKKLAEKLKNIKASVKLWRNSAREASVKEEEDLGDLISELEILAEERPFTDDELTDRLNCKQKLAEIHNIKSMDLKQKSRSILDGPLVVNEAMAWIKKMKMKALMLKVDLEKAFDSLSWSFLDMIMSHMQFPPLWRKWILGTLSNARSSILVNGSPTREFCIKRGVRQGDPLSPFLFILAMEALNVVMTKANSLGTFRGISIHHNGPTLSHLFFADDAIFMGEWSERNALNLTRILRCFYLASGLKVNYKKSRIFGLGVVENDVNNMAIVLNCQVGKLPFKYLGIPMGANMNHIKNWKDVIDIFESRLSSWKANALSFGGRITLLKSVLGSLPIYYFSLFKAPIHVIECLEKLRKKFLWSGNNPSAKIHWLKWDRIMAPKNMGGKNVLY
ncbi:hypothetical protein QVD17_17645 [Tagetes erecta]|uniref:Reverse transcriptase domain-containing protein n=1 Tax=Tagetes erecta TaxID=13708 RepID=A0AAD8NUJ2_TARER|nr:hypothetical protein QVD17_17645 [Tagetes erecta]